MVKFPVTIILTAKTYHQKYDVSIIIRQTAENIIICISIYRWLLKASK